MFARNLPSKTSVMRCLSFGLANLLACAAGADAQRPEVAVDLLRFGGTVEWRLSASPGIWARSATPTILGAPSGSVAFAPPETTLPVNAYRSPLLAGTLGFVIPGGGHVYAGESGRGWLVLGVTFVGAYFALTDGTPRAAATVGSAAFVGGWIFSVVDGTLAAGRHNRRR